MHLAFGVVPRETQGRGTWGSGREACCCRQSCDEIQRLENHMRRAILVRRLELVANVAIRGERQPLLRHCRS